MDMGCCNSEFHALSDDRITRVKLSYNHPCPSSPSSTILRSAYMALKTTARLATLIKYIYIYIYIYIVEEGLDGHGLLLLRVSRVMRSSELSDDRITRETLSNNNPCPSSPSSTILRSAYMALNTLQQDWLL